MRSLLIAVQRILNNFYNFTALTPNTSYVVDVGSISSTCSGASKTISVTTSTREAGVPRSELHSITTYIRTLLSTKLKKLICN